MRTVLKRILLLYILHLWLLYKKRNAPKHKQHIKIELQKQKQKYGKINLHFLKDSTDSLYHFFQFPLEFSQFLFLIAYLHVHTYRQNCIQIANLSQR